MINDRIDFTKSMNTSDYNILNNFDEIIAMFDLVNIQSNDINISTTEFNNQLIFNLQSNDIPKLKTFLDRETINIYNKKYDIVYSENNNCLSVVLKNISSTI